jgi:hypothetical protein
MFEIFETKHRLAFPGIKRLTGRVERTNRTVANFLRKIMQQLRVPFNQWSDFIHYVQLLINTTLSRPINNTPFCAVFGRQPKYLFHSVHPDTRDLLDVVSVEDEEHKAVTANVIGNLGLWYNTRFYHDELNIINMRLYRQGYIDRYASAYNGSIRPIRNHFKPGQYVLTVNAVTNKLDPRWTEPLCVVHYSPKRGYKLRHLGGMAAPLLDRRYPHSILKFAANQAEAKKKDEEEIIVHTITNREEGDPPVYTITRVARPFSTKPIKVTVLAKDMKGRYDRMFNDWLLRYNKAVEEGVQSNRLPKKPVLENIISDANHPLLRLSCIEDYVPSEGEEREDSNKDENKKKKKTKKARNDKPADTVPAALAQAPVP